MLVAFAVALRGSAACESTAPTEKPTRLRAGRVIWVPPADGFDLACGHIAEVPRAKAHQAHFLPFGDFLRTTSVKASRIPLVSKAGTL